MKTELTREIEQAVKDWRPDRIGDVKVNKFRAQHTALEVPVDCGTTSGGIIDAVRISEYFGDVEYRNICRPAKWRKDGLRPTILCPKGKDMTGKLDLYCDEKSCRLNGVSKDGTPKILLTCIEIKVTKADFKSEHGHNFIGNLNFYAVPEELFKEIEPLVPEGIGILVYLHKGVYKGLRTKRRPVFREMTDGDQKWLILSAFKRVRDMDRAHYIEMLQRKPTDYF